MNPIERISRMEAVLRKAEGVLERLGDALEDYADLQEELRALDAYYGSQDWLDDLDLDRAGGLPEGLNRGVLSEDEIYDLLEQERELQLRMRELLARFPEA
jgi:hypothetical protein